MCWRLLHIWSSIFLYVEFLFIHNIFILWTFTFNNYDILLYPIFWTYLHISAYDIKIFSFIVSHITLDYYYIKKIPPKKISLYNKKCFILITWNQYSDVGLSHVLLWLHPPQNNFILVISPWYKYLWHHYVLYIYFQNSK